MNANSRRILERRQLRSTETGKHVVSEAGPTAAEGRKVTERHTTKSVPVNTLTLKTAKKANESGEESSFAPKINKRSMQMAKSKREGKIEDHLL